MPLVVIGLVAMLAMAGLAIDSGHAFVNKTRLQNTADAAALSAAKVYAETTDTIPGTATAHSTFGINTDGSGNFEIDAAYDAGDISVVVQWSPTLLPFVPSGIGPYVRVIATGFNMGTTFSRVVGIDTMAISASAVAGPSPAITDACNIAPIVVCANEPTDSDFGFVDNKLEVLKPNPGDHGDVGPGNFKMLRLDCPGGDCLREAMAGSEEVCASADSTVETEPGMSAGPTSQGFNTRFGIYAGPISPGDYPPDLVTDAVDPLFDTYPDPVTGDDIITQGGTPVAVAADIAGYDYDSYVTKVANPAFHNFAAPVGVAWRRVLALPVADCSGDDSGQSTLEIMGFACYFMLQQVEGGSEMNIYGQFVDGCLAGGVSGVNPGVGPLFRIQLYKDPDSGDS